MNFMTRDEHCLLDEKRTEGRLTKTRAFVSLFVSCASLVGFIQGCGTHKSHSGDARGETPADTVNGDEFGIGSGASPTHNELGINISHFSDYQEDRILTDVMRMCRTFELPAGGAAPIDANGYPTKDFKVIVWHGIANMHGTYALSFKGQVSGIVASIGKATVSGLKYDAATNTTTAQIVYSNTESAGLTLEFKGTKRTAGAAAGSGLTDLKMMRPLSPGSTQSYAATQRFTTHFKNLLGKFTTVRLMDLMATNNNMQTKWSDRAKMNYASWSRKGGEGGYGWQGLGAPWEMVALIANETNKNVWINIPARVDQDYVLKVAQMLKYGSDGVNPYTSPVANPVYPPLKPGLKLYVEYANEVWNSAGAFSGNFTYNADRAAAEVAAGKSPLNFDGDANKWNWAWRRVAKRTIEISNTFRQVFGDNAMMNTVRPVLMGQVGNGQGMLSNMLHILHGYYNNGMGNFVSTPRPPSYYIYGASGSAYYGPENENPGLNLSNIWTSDEMDVEKWKKPMAKDADLVAALGVRRIAYEGGPSLDHHNTAVAVKSAARDDARMTNELLEHHRAWSQHGGELLMYFTLTGDYQWGFTNSSLQPTSAKMNAVNQLAGAASAPITHGAKLPAVLDGKAFSLSSRGYDSPSTGALALGSAAGQISFATYTVRSDATATRTVRLELGAVAANTTVLVNIDGNQVAKLTPTSNTSVNVSTRSFPTGLHGVILSVPAGSAEIKKVRIE